MTQLNTPYPATSYLVGFLKEYGYVAEQADIGLELILELFSRPGLTRLAAALAEAERAVRAKPAVRSFEAMLERYLATVEPVVRFLQGKDPSLATRIAGGRFLPEGTRFAQLRAMETQAAAAAERGEPAYDPLPWAFGTLGHTDQAKYLASLYLDDLADVVAALDPRFTLSRYGERLAASAVSFTPLVEALEGPPSLIDTMVDELGSKIAASYEPDVVGFSVPFPGNFYGALRLARMIKKHRPNVRCLLGGGYVNTELRELSEPRLFDIFDYVTLDDGERPLLNLLEHMAGKRGRDSLVRTFTCEDGKVVYREGSGETANVPLAKSGTPTYAGLQLDRYLSVTELLNPMHRLWSDGRWNKLTMAHGCYWRKCSFCDTSLDYIGRYEEQDAQTLLARIEALIEETGQTGFHFVDEAAPPKMMLALARAILSRGLTMSWWGNVRFEKTFTPAVAEILARSGLVAVSGGLEVASDRLLSLMQKGVTVEQVARVTKAFSDNGVLVHAYLMYGFPTQTEAETIDALERVRQLFLAGCLDSVYWHRFSATVHSPIGKDPERFGIKLIQPPPGAFARNDIDFIDPTSVDHDALGVGLRKAVYNYMHGLGLDEDVRAWFDVSVPKPKVPRDLIAKALRGEKARTPGEKPAYAKVQSKRQGGGDERAARSSSRAGEH